jgi:hypothetical protein
LFQEIGVGTMETAEQLGFLSKLSPDDLIALKQFVDRHMEESFRTNALLQRLAGASVRSELINETLTAITEKTGAIPEEAMVLALTLYDVAVDATRQGQRLILVDKDYRFVREVTGLLQRTPESPSHERVAG